MPSSEDPSTAHARWLAEVALALDEAERVSEQLTRLGHARAEVDAVRLRILSVRAEIEVMRRGRTAPKWSRRGAPPRHDPVP